MIGMQIWGKYYAGNSEMPYSIHLGLHALRFRNLLDETGSRRLRLQKLGSAVAPMSVQVELLVLSMFEKNNCRSITGNICC
jgi:hypothetical protein